MLQFALYRLRHALLGHGGETRRQDLPDAAALRVAARVMKVHFSLLAGSIKAAPLVGTVFVPWIGINLAEILVWPSSGAWPNTAVPNTTRSADPAEPSTVPYSDSCGAGPCGWLEA